jgi:hypothetical protein
VDLAVSQAEHGGDGLDGPRGAEEMADHALGRGQGHLRRARAEGGLEGRELRDVVERRARPVRVDEVHLVRIEPRVGEGAGQGEAAPALGMGRGQWLASQEAPEPRSSARGRPTRPCVRERFEEKHARAFPIDMPARPSRNGRQGASSTARRALNPA